MKSCNEAVQALYEGQAGKISKGSCPPYERAAGVHGASSVWQWIKGKRWLVDILMNVSNKPSDQKEQVEEILCRQIGATSHLQYLDLMEDFNFPDTF